MINQVLYQTNADYTASYEALYKSGIIDSISQTEKGLITFRIGVTGFVLSPNGKLQVKWSNLEEKKTLLETVKDLLIPKKGELTMNPLSQQLWLHHPQPPEIAVHWCNKKIRYAKVNVDHLPKRMREMWNLDVEAYRFLLGNDMQLDKIRGSLFGTPFVLCSE